MQTISAYILAFNEAEKVAAAVESVLWTDEIVVIDSQSTDQTAEIAAALGARVIQVPFNGFGSLRNEGFELLTGNPVGTLHHAIWQFPFRDLEEVLTKANRYSSLGVPKLANKRVSMTSTPVHGLWAFLKHYIFKLGFIDGWAGFVIAFGNFEGTYYRYAKHYEKAQNWAPPASEPLRREAGESAKI
jgi:glycosyltransferase involved in cell wall biosynthesis